MMETLKLCEQEFIKFMRMKGRKKIKKKKNK